MERQAFLDGLRRSLADEMPPNAAHPPPAVIGVPSIAYASAAEGDVTNRFQEAAEAHGSVVRRVSRPADLTDLIAEIGSTYGSTIAVLSSDQETEGLRELLAERGIAAGHYLDPSTPATLGITGALAGIARTGSLVVSSARAGSRGASLIPPVHLCILRASAIVDAPSDVWRRWDVFLEGDPSQIVFVTGPSKSGDIEGVLATGVHGPVAVWIAITEE